MIQQVTIKNFKCLRDVSVNLERFTVFVGANGSGKTSLLQAIDLLCRAFRHEPGTLNGEFDRHRAHASDEPIEFECNSDSGQYRYRVSSDSPKQQPHSQWNDDGPAVWAESLPAWQPWQLSYGIFPSPLWLRLDAKSLQTVGSIGNDPREMAPNGQGMHSATASMALEDPDLWQRLQSDLTRIVPSIRRLRHTPQNELLFDAVNGKGLKAHQVSEGTLLTLGLLTAIHGENKPGILLLDDLDRALHPKAQRELIELLRGIQNTNPEIQIVGSTHSPYLLGKMEPNEVQVTYLRDDGSTACEPLTHHPSFSKWRDEFHPGEMWSLFGEHWVAHPEAAAK